MSSFKESFRKAMEQAEQEASENPQRVIHVKTTPNGYLLASSGFLILVFFLLVFLGPQTLLSKEHKTVIGVFQKEDLVYAARGELIVHEDARNFGYSYTKGSRKRNASNGRRFQRQVISYKKHNPEEFVYAFGLDGNLSDLSHPTLHNFLLVGLGLLFVLNLFFVRWASSNRAKKFMEALPEESK